MQSRAAEAWLPLFPAGFVRHRSEVAVELICSTYACPQFTVVSTGSNANVSPTAVELESRLPEGSSSTAAAFQKTRVILNWRMRGRRASTFQSLSSTTTSIGNNIPTVCTPCDGTMSSPSPEESLRSPSSPTILLNPVSATRMHSPRIVPRVRLTARTVLFWNRMLLGQLLKHSLEINNCRPQRDHENAGEDEQDQREKKFHSGFGRHFLCRLHAARPQCVRKYAQRMGHRRAKALSLHQHGDKLADEIDIQPFRHAAPCIQPGLAGALLTADNLELFREARRGDGHFLADAHHGLVDPQACFHADHQQIERVRQRPADVLLAPGHQMGKNKIGKKKSSHAADNDSNHQVTGEETAQNDSHQWQKQLDGGIYLNVFRLTKTREGEFVSQVLIKYGDEPANRIKCAGDARCRPAQSSTGGRHHEGLVAFRGESRNFHQAGFHRVSAGQQQEHGDHQKEDRNRSRN